jgi:ATP-dependent phosphofructokinase / diphosphate-dependent phosphofructokinase
MSTPKQLTKMALLVGGGPAPGINGVISAATIEAINNRIEVFGVPDGFKHLVKGKVEMLKRLSIDDVKNIHYRGGSILGTSRTNPTKSPEDMSNVLGVFRQLGIDGLVTIGGDDTAFSASEVHRMAAGEIRVAHVPKTIDNDLPLPGSVPTFGFETARQLGVRLVRNLAEDARTTSRWYVIVSMGRAAGHLALGIGKAAAATLTIIPEEFRGRQVTLDEVCDIILGSMIKRASTNTHYGVVVLAEGLIGAIGEQGLVSAMESAGVVGRYGKVVVDPHGHLRLGEIEFARMVLDRLAAKLSEIREMSGVRGPASAPTQPSPHPYPPPPRGEGWVGGGGQGGGPRDILDITLIDKDLGYELRCADPNPFDAEYTRDLGYAAVKFLRTVDSARWTVDGGKDRIASPSTVHRPLSNTSGAIISFDEGRMQPLPFVDMINPQTKRMKTRKVDVDGEGYECALRYMFRLKKSDFADELQLQKIAATAGMTPDQFRQRFEYLVEKE